MPPKLERCVKKVKRRAGVRNAWAVCSASTGYVRKKGGGWRKKRKRKASSSRRRKGRWY